VSELETIRFPVRGMVCASCVSRITRAVRKLEGVESVAVDLRRETATVVREPAAAPNAALGEAVARAGYEADLAAAEVLATARRRGVVDRLLRRIA
jgi:P-type Cu+ transporter